jgi:hypothetical protein
MKNYWSTALASVRQAMFSVFGSEKLPRLGSQAENQKITKWKQNPKVKACHKLLFETNAAGNYCVAEIACVAFPETSVPTMTNYHLSFTLSVCDIFLNSKSKGIICKESEMKKRLEFYQV